MTTFDVREQGYENKFAHEQETDFKVLARMSHLLGLWAAEKIQLAAGAAENYSQTLVEIVASHNASAAVKNKLQKDFSAAGIEIGANDIENEMNRLLEVARTQVINIG